MNDVKDERAVLGEQHLRGAEARLVEEHAAGRIDLSQYQQATADLDRQYIQALASQ